jgi:hypothetical protein
MKKNRLFVGWFVARSKVKGQKNIFLQEHQNLDFHAEGRSNGGRPCPSGVKRASTSEFKGQKNIFYKNIKISIFTPKEGPMVDDRVLPGSKEHQLPGSKVKKTFFTKTSKSRFSRRRKVQWWTTVSFRGQKNINFRVQRSLL